MPVRCKVTEGRQERTYCSGSLTGLGTPPNSMFRPSALFEADPPRGGCPAGGDQDKALPQDRSWLSAIMDFDWAEAKEAPNQSWDAPASRDRDSCPGVMSRCRFRFCCPCCSALEWMNSAPRPMRPVIAYCPNCFPIQSTMRGAFFDVLSARSLQL